MRRAAADVRCALGVTSRALKRAALWAVMSVTVALLLLAFVTCPVWRHYHFGCDAWEGSHQTERVWMGVRFCRLQSAQEIELTRAGEP